MKSINLMLFFVLSILNLTMCNSQIQKSNQVTIGDSVDLYRQFSADFGYDLFFEKKSDTPYTGQLIGYMNSEKIILNLKNGYLDSNFIRLNETNDTLELIKYSNGKEIFSIFFKYENDKLIERTKTEKVKGNNLDKEIFIKALNFFKNKKFDELDDYLNPLWSEYRSTSATCEMLFGELLDFKINKLDKTYIKNQNSEHLNAKIELFFKDTSIEIGFFIVASADKLSGEGITFGPFNYNLIHDTIENNLINIILDRNVDDLVKIKPFTESNRNFFNHFFENMEKVNGTAKFMNSLLLSLPITQLNNFYLFNFEKGQQVLSITYNISQNGDLELVTFKFMPYRIPYMTMQKSI